MLDKIRSDKQVFRSMANYVNAYIKFKSDKNFSEIEVLLKHFFDASDIKIWYCDRDTKALREFAKKDTNTLIMDMSLTERVIESKKPLIENYITSNKYFTPSIDNPLELKVKSLLMFPLIRHKKVIGIVRVWRGMKQRKNFSKKDEESLAFLAPVFVGLLESISIENDLILSIVGKEFINKDSVVIENENLIVKKKILPKAEVKEKIKRSKVPKNSVKESALEVLEKKYLLLKKEKSQQEKALKKALEVYKVKSINTLQDSKSKHEKESKNYNLAIEKSKETINALEKKIKNYSLENRENNKKSEEVLSSKKDEIKDLTKRLTTATTTISKHDTILENMQKELLLGIQKYQQSELNTVKLENNISIENQKMKQLEEALERFKIQNKILENRITKLKLVDTPTTIRALKSQQAQSQSSPLILTDKVESLLEVFDQSFNSNEFTYIYFEMIIYVLASKKGMEDIEEILKRSKVLPEIIDFFYFKGDLVIHNERNTIANLVTHISSYEKNILFNKTKIHINVEQEMPSSLIFDRIKIQSILLHLVNDLSKFIDDNNDITLDISFQDKLLQIELGAIIHQKNTLFNTMFQQTKLAIDNKDRLGLQLSRKIIERLKGKLDFSYEDSAYKFILTLPVQVIKL